MKPRAVIFLTCLLLTQVAWGASTNLESRIGNMNHALVAQASAPAVSDSSSPPVPETHTGTTAPLSSRTVEYATASFDAANRLYDEGKYTHAVAAYEQLIQAGKVSPAVYFNLGDACFKAGQIGQAIVAFRRAGRLTPRDPDIEANLRFARKRVQGPTMQIGRWQNALATLSLNEWAWLAAGAFWLLCLLLAIGQVRSGWKRGLRWYVVLAGAAVIVLGSGLGLALTEHSQSKIVVVVHPDVTVRSGPFSGSQEMFTAQDGAELQILDHKDDWLQVTDGANHIGWLKREQVVVMPSV